MLSDRIARHRLGIPISSKDEIPFSTPEAIGTSGGLLLAILGTLIKMDVLVGVGSSLAASAIFSALVRKSRGEE